MPLISVIVPVYKVEAYLPACVESILTQTFTDFELLLVDDGSPDRCGEMCDEYAQKDARVRVIHQQNGGVSAARNTGMDAAAGEYITFVDSDDLIDPEYLEALYTAITENGANVSCCHFLSFKDEAPLRDAAAPHTENPTRMMTGTEAALRFYVGVTVWGKLYSKELLLGHRFPVGKIHEDQAFVPVVLCEARLVASIDQQYYSYRIRPNSITSSGFSIKQFDNVENIDLCIHYFKEHGYADLEAAALEKKKKVQSMLVIQAHSAGASKFIPLRYRLSKMQALRNYYQCVSDDEYSWYLAKLYPHGVIFHEYYKKLKKELHRLIRR